MKGRSTILLGLAVVCGLGAMYGTKQLLPKSQVEEEQDVLVAARDLNDEEAIKDDMVKVVKFKKSNVPAGSFTSPKQLADRWVNLKMLADEPIIEAKLAPKGTPIGLVARIPKGMRAFTIDVNEQTGVSGFVMPNNHVDVVQAKMGKGVHQLDAEAETILQDVLVLASGQTFSKPEDKSILVHSVTLALAPDQVRTLVASQKNGPLSLALRGLNDHVVTKTPEPPPPPVPAPAPPPEPRLPIAPPPVVAVASIERPRAQPKRVIRVIHGLQRIWPPEPSRPSELEQNQRGGGAGAGL